jgi:carbohydrate-selective porin OprB
MPKILHTGKQFVLTISPDIMKAMGWKKGTEVILSKVPGENQVYLEKIESTQSTTSIHVAKTFNKKVKVTKQKK